MKIMFNKSDEELTEEIKKLKKTAKDLRLQLKGSKEDTKGWRLRCLDAEACMRRFETLHTEMAEEHYKKHSSFLK